MGFYVQQHFEDLYLCYRIYRNRQSAVSGMGDGMTGDVTRNPKFSTEHSASSGFSNSKRTREGMTGERMQTIITMMSGERRRRGRVPCSLSEIWRGIGRKTTQVEDRNKLSR